jgi:hypothetical protein
VNQSEDKSGTIRVSIEEAARLLGIEKGSVKKRVQRGKLSSERDASGTLYVFLDKSETVRDRSMGQSETGRDELLMSKDETISILRAQLREEREARRRADTLLAQLMQRIPELEAPASEAAEPQEPPGASERAEEVADRGRAPQARERAAERPWWRRVFGG